MSVPLKSYPANNPNPEISNADVGMNIPASLVPQRMELPMSGCESAIRVIPAANGASQNPSGILLFGIPGGAGYMKARSAYIKFRVTITATNGNYVYFKKSAASLINRVTLYGNGSTLLETTNQYDAYHRFLLEQTTTQNYYATDAGIMEWNNQVLGGQLVAGTSVVVDCQIPIALSTLNNEKSFPLFLCNSSQGLLLQVDLNPVNRALYALTGTGAAGTAPTNYVVSNPFIVYEHLTVNPMYEAAIRQKLRDGFVYNMNLPNCCLGSTYTSAAGSSTYNLGVGINSVDAVVLCQQVGAGGTLNVGTQDNPFVQNSTFTGATSSSSAALTCVLFADGSQVIQANGDETMSYAESARALGNLWDVNICNACPNIQFTGLTDVNANAVIGTCALGIIPRVNQLGYRLPMSAAESVAEAPIAPTYNNAATVAARLTDGYQGGYYFKAWNLRKFSESDIAFSGRKVQNLSVLKQNAQVASQDFLFILHSQSLKIDASGQMAVSR
jgi:hypothetical protein